MIIGQQFLSRGVPADGITLKSGSDIATLLTSKCSSITSFSVTPYVGTTSATGTGDFDCEGEMPYVVSGTSLTIYGRPYVSGQMFVYMNQNSQGMFSGRTALSSFPLGIFNALNNVNGLKIPNQMNCANMFNGCSSLTGKIDMGGYWIANAHSMFRNCHKLTGQVPLFSSDMSYAYAYCENISSCVFYVTGITNMSHTFMGSGILLASSPDTVVNMEGCYQDCPKVYQPACGANVDTMAWCYHGCTNLKSVAVGAKVTNLAACFNGCTNITSAPQCPNTVKNMYLAYRGCSNLTGNAIVSANAENMHMAYSGCGKITGLNFYSTKATVMYAAFGSCVNMTGSPKVPDTATDCYMAYYYCPKLTGTAAIGNKMTRTTYMYQYSTGLTSIQSGKVAGSCTEIIQMFYGCTGLTCAAPASTTFPNATTMTGMFHGCTKLSGAAVIYPKALECTNAYRGCTNITTVNTSAKPVAAANMQYCFYGCTKLNVNLGAWFPTSGIANGQYMFSGCTGMVNGKLTYGAADSSHMWEGCTNLTVANIGSKVTNAYAMFSGCTKLTSMPDIGGLCTNMKFAFANCPLVGSVTLPKSVTDIERLFENAVINGNLNIRINNASVYIGAGIFWRDYWNKSYRINVFVNGGSSGAAYKNIISSTYGFCASPKLTWTSTTNGVYNATYNVYVYYNWTGNT